VDCLTSLQYFDKLATKLKARGRLHVPRVFLFLSSNGRDKVKLSPHIVDKTESHPQLQHPVPAIILQYGSVALLAV